jgi:hypothetical protein
MPAKYWAFFVFLFIVGTMMGLLIENELLSPDEQSTVQGLMIWEETSSEDGFGGFITTAAGYFPSLLKTMVWDFAFITGLWMYIKWIVWAPLMAMMVWGLIITFIGALQKIL